ncbi:MAG: hypothetical protein Tsb009_39060 [Planctomycetaceae bacterium]
MSTLAQDSLGFEASYAVSETSAQQPTAFQRYIFDWQRSEARTGELQFETPTGEPLALEIYPTEGDPWIGIFRSGAGGLNGVFGTPSPDIVCVVSNGQGYWVPVSEPGEFVEIQSSPILHVFAIPSCKLIGFVDFTEIEAYGPEGQLWITERLSWDGLEIVETTERGIRGQAWDSPANEHVEFVVDPHDGTHVGGSSPESYKRKSQT